MQKLNTTDYKVMEKIMKNSKISRTDLAKYLELTPAAISKIIKKLLSYNLIIEKNTLFSTGGRPRVTLAINSNYKKIIGVNLGAGFINIVESNLNGEIIGITERKFAFKGQEKVLELLDEELTKALSKYDKESVIGIGLATHGVVDRKKGTVIDQLADYILHQKHIPVHKAQNNAQFDIANKDESGWNKRNFHIVEQGKVFAKAITFHARLPREDKARNIHPQIF